MMPGKYKTAYLFWISDYLINISCFHSPGDTFTLQSSRAEFILE